MRYQFLEEAGRLEIEYEGPDLDAYTLGVLQINLHFIVEKVAERLLANERFIEYPYRGTYFRRYESPIVRARITELRSGSLYEVVGLSVAAAIADPNVVAVLHGISGNVVYAILMSGVRGVRGRFDRGRPSGPPSSDQLDQFDIGTNLRDVVLAAVENADGQSVSIKVRSTTPGGEAEAEIRIGGDQDE